MPYISKERRNDFLELLGNIPSINHPGELNYIITEICIRYLLHNDICYHTLNDVAGALQEVYSELRERVIKPYERSKRLGVGDTSYAQLDSLLQKLGCEINP